MCKCVGPKKGDIFVQGGGGVLGHLGQPLGRHRWPFAFVLAPRLANMRIHVATWQPHTGKMLPQMRFFPITIIHYVI